jgi:hypothetical protein
MRPRLLPRRGPGGADRRDGVVSVTGQGVDQPRHRRVGRDRSEQFRLRPHHRKISQAVTAERDRDRKVDHDLRRVVAGAPRPPGRQRRAQPTIQTGGPSGLDQQRRAGRRDQRLAARDNLNTSPAPVTLHPRSAFPPDLLTSSASDRISDGTGTSVLLPNVSQRKIDLFVKARG